MTEEEEEKRAPSPKRERSPRRNSSSQDGRREPSQGSSGKESRAKTVYYEVGAQHASPPRSSSRGANPRDPHGSPSTRTPEPRKPPPSPRATEKGAAETPPSSHEKNFSPKADEAVAARHAEAMEEIAMLRQMLSLQARAQEESQTSVRVVARSELQSFEFAQQQATIRVREDMVAGLGAPPGNPNPCPSGTGGG